MQDSPNIARAAALIGDPARALMLQALMSGRALTASERAETAGVSKATASSHLAQLQAGALITARPEGRHKYLSLAWPAVTRALESLMVLAAGQGARIPKTGPRDPALRQTRACYNHLAGTRGVQAYDSLIARGAFTHAAGGLNLTAAGAHIFTEKGLDPALLTAPQTAPQTAQKTPLCRDCLVGASGAITSRAALAARS
jgi:DNA-binding transcriptional ArsR family regulator